MKQEPLLASFILVVIFFVLGGSLCAQTPDRATRADVNNATAATAANEVLANARRLYAEEGARAALPEFERALGLFRQLKDEKSEAITLGLIGNCYKKFGDHTKAFDYLQQALAMK
jgi:tetratricopeptide (TPR) repeat protein